MLQELTEELVVLVVARLDVSEPRAPFTPVTAFMSDVSSSAKSVMSLSTAVALWLIDVSALARLSAAAAVAFARSIRARKASTVRLSDRVCPAIMAGPLQRPVEFAVAWNYVNEVREDEFHG